MMYTVIGCIVAVGATVATTYFRASGRPRLIYDKTDENMALLRACHLLEMPYRPTPWCFGKHFQTAISSTLRRSAIVVYRREIINMPSDNGTVALDWCGREQESTSVEAENDNIPILLILHGVTGGSAESYVTQLVWAAREIGWHAVVFNNRGCAQSDLTTPRAYCAADTSDLATVVNYIHQRNPRSPLVAVGFSMGANILTKYLGEYGSSTSILAAVSLANPLDLVESSKLLNSGISNYLYNPAIAARLRAYVSRHQSILQTRFRLLVVL